MPQLAPSNFVTDAEAIVRITHFFTLPLEGHDQTNGQITNPRVLNGRYCYLSTDSFWFWVVWSVGPLRTDHRPVSAMSNPWWQLKKVTNKVSILACVVLVPSLVTDFDLVLVLIYDANLLKHRQIQLSMYEANLLTVICNRWWRRGSLWQMKSP